MTAIYHWKTSACCLSSFMHISSNQIIYIIALTFSASKLASYYFFVNNYCHCFTYIHLFFNIIDEIVTLSMKYWIQLNNIIIFILIAFLSMLFLIQITSKTFHILQYNWWNKLFYCSYLFITKREMLWY